MEEKELNFDILDEDAGIIVEFDSLSEEDYSYEIAMCHSAKECMK